MSVQSLHKTCCFCKLCAFYNHFTPKLNLTSATIILSLNSFHLEISNCDATRARIERESHHGYQSLGEKLKTSGHIIAIKVDHEILGRLESKPGTKGLIHNVFLN